jgi:hypothetical protein
MLINIYTLCTLGLLYLETRDRQKDGRTCRLLVLEESTDVNQKKFKILEVSDQCYSHYAMHGVSALVLLDAMRTCYNVVMGTASN